MVSMQEPIAATLKTWHSGGYSEHQKEEACLYDVIKVAGFEAGSTPGLYYGSCMPSSPKEYIAKGY